MNRIHDTSEIRKEPLRWNGRVIGELVGRKAVFYVSSRNWFRAGNGYSVDALLLEGLDGHVDTIEFFNRNERRRETIPFERFIARGWATKDYGFGRKYVAGCQFYDSRFNPPPPEPPEPPAAPCLFPLPTPPSPVLSAAGAYH